MSILDDAIREHLELKRAHGADDAELKKLEDEAFGPPARPGEGDAFSEGPTEFLAAPATDAADAAAEAQAEPSGRRVPNIADLQEAPPPPSPEDAEPDAEEAPVAEVSPEQETIPVPHPETEAKPEDAASTDEPAAAGKGDTASEDAAPGVDAGPSTEEREAIAEEPTELFDVEADIGAGAERPSPTDEQLLDSQLSEPRLAPVDPTGAIESTGPDAEVAGEPIADEEEEDDDFFSEQRLSDELNQALEAPITDEHEAPATEAPAPSFPDTDEHETRPATDEHETFSDTDEQEAAPATDEHEADPPSEEHTAIYDVSEHGTDEEDDEDEDEDDEPAPRPAAEPEDVLEDTPDFLEDAPEDDELWFEQKPPKDFDFDD